MKTNWFFAQKNQLNEPDVRILNKRNETDFDVTIKVGNTDDRGGDKASQKTPVATAEAVVAVSLEPWSPPRGSPETPHSLPS
jgi:hypothetical protein